MRSYSVFFANYTIGEDAYVQVPQVCRPFGTKIFLIGGRKAMDAAGGLLEEVLKGTDLVVLESVEFGSDCTYKTIDRWADRAKELGADMIFGMGGGKALDTAKGAAERAGLPVFTFPTIAATCAATTALSVVYREDGNFDSFYFYDKPARHCFINTRVIADAPWEYLRAGMGDTMGKFFECHFAARGDWAGRSATCVMAPSWSTVSRLLRTAKDMSHPLPCSRQCWQISSAQAWYP